MTCGTLNDRIAARKAGGRNGSGMEGAGSQALEGAGSEATAFIQQQVQAIFQAALPHLIRQISEKVAVLPLLGSPSTAARTSDRGPRAKWRI